MKRKEKKYTSIRTKMPDENPYEKFKKKFRRKKSK